eukprot:TRINITY_DN9118_c0_g1_i1.p2 TRINITY_DN9118_c0_g1~~TRINITY_DN9118_c0_g1_i1.p2  ORF type:complete len:124 (+),score=61.66 TRINITY_DN9118_c0_g1_i1:691-1062(+)
MGRVGEFRVSHILAWLTIPPALYLNYEAATDPANMHFQAAFWWVKDVAAQYPHLFMGLFKMGVVLHILEALFVLVKALRAKVAPADALLWTVQTLILGGPSTMPFLKSLKPKGGKKEEEGKDA